MIKAEVTNTGAGLIGRVGYSFEPGESKTVEVDPSQFPELYQHPSLSVVVTHYDSPTEVPENASDHGVEVKINATDAALRRANEGGLDISQVQGTGQGGRVKESDVDQALSETGARDPHVFARDFIPEGKVSTLDSEEAQREARLAAQRNLRETALTGRPESEGEPRAEGEASEPSQASATVPQQAAEERAPAVTDEEQVEREAQR